MGKAIGTSHYTGARDAALLLHFDDFPLPTPEYLIIMKAAAHRPKELADIQAIVAGHPDLDKTRIQFWVEQFGTALNLPDLWQVISQLLAN